MIKISRLLPFSLAIVASTFSAIAVDFDRHFCDSTLRIDYTLAGDSRGTAVYFDGAHVDPTCWAGRRHHLDVMPLRGNGAVTVRTAGTDSIIYKNTFSTLFNEWLCTDEAQTTPRSYEHVVLIPMPLHPVDIELSLFNTRQDTMATTVHRVDPGDILLRQPSSSHTPTPHRYLHRGGDPRDVIDVVIMAEGYTPDEMESFYAHADSAVSSLRRHEPFGSMMDRFNIVAVASPSAESGVSIPRLGEWHDTAVGSHFSTFYSTRYLTTPHVKRIHDLLQGIPYEHIIILANTPEYGGGGIYNSYTLTTSRNENFAPVIVHEFGHSFGGLGDEYFYDNDVMSGSYPIEPEPWEPNITTHPHQAKWSHMLTDGTPIPTPVEQADDFPVGVYLGAAYTSHDAYRPADHCRMRDNVTKDFCPVCQASLKSLIEFYTTE